MTDVSTLIKGAKELGYEMGQNEINQFIAYKELLK